jgi:hypothetical protein
MVDYATLDEIRAEGNFQASDIQNNDQIESLITSVSRMIDAQLGTVFAPDSDLTRSFTVDDLIADRSSDLFLGRHRLLSITSIVNADGTSIAVGDVILLPQGFERKHTIRIKSTSESSWVSDEDDEITITGRWGYSTAVPADVKQMCAEWVIHVFNGRGDNGTSGNATIISPDGVVISPNSAPPRVRDFLKHSKYKRRA